MKTTDILRPVMLGFISLLSVSLLPAVAHADHHHGRSDDPGITNHLVHEDPGYRHERHEHHHRAENRYHERHHDYREETWRNQPRHVVWERPLNRPQLIIRLPWLIFVDY